MERKFITNHRTPQTSDTRSSATITLNPEGLIPEKQRRRIARRSFIQFNIAADGNGGFLPDEFHEPSLRWLLDQASVVILWAGEVDAPAHVSETSQLMIRAAAAPHVRTGGRVAQINVEDPHWGQWFAYVNEHTRPGTEVTCVLEPTAGKR